MNYTKETSKRYFDEKVNVYTEEGYFRIRGKYPVLYIRHKYILNMINEGEGIAIDVGCGPGIMLLDLKAKGYDVIGLDISKNMLEKARDIFLRLGAEIPNMAVADIECLPFRREVFDLIVCAGVIEYLDRDDKALTEISRTLKTGGLTMITFTNALTPFWIIETISKISGIWPKILSLVKGEKNPPKSRVHIPHMISRLAEKIGLKEICRAYFNFTILPFPLDFNNQAIRRKVGFKMERLSRKILGIIGRGCIIKFKKMSSIE